MVDNYMSIVFADTAADEGIILRKMHTFRSNLHISSLMNKIALCQIDDKRCILDDNVNTLSWCHHSKINPPFWMTF